LPAGVKLLKTGLRKVSELVRVPLAKATPAEQAPSAVPVELLTVWADVSTKFQVMVSPCPMVILFVPTSAEFKLVCVKYLVPVPTFTVQLAAYKGFRLKRKKPINRRDHFIILTRKIAFPIFPSGLLLS
jgi:hypothetical protein